MPQSYGTYDTATLDRTRKTIRDMTTAFMEREKTKLAMEKDVWEKKGVDQVLGKYMAETQGIIGEDQEQPTQETPTPPATPNMSVKPGESKSIETKTKTSTKEILPIQGIDQIYQKALQARVELQKYGKRGAEAAQLVNDDLKMKLSIASAKQRAHEHSVEQATKWSIEQEKLKAKRAGEREAEDKKLTTLKTNKESKERLLKQMFPNLDLNQVVSGADQFYQNAEGKLSTNPEMALSGYQPVKLINDYRKAMQDLYAYMDEKEIPYDDPFGSAKVRRDIRLQSEVRRISEKYPDADLDAIMAKSSSDPEVKKEIKDTAIILGITEKALVNRIKGIRKTPKGASPGPDPDGREHPGTGNKPGAKKTGDWLEGPGGIYRRIYD